MAVLTIVQEPPAVQSAYKPLLVSLTSMRSPSNGMAGESAPVSAIRAATSTDVFIFGGGLVVGDVIVIHAAVLAGTFVIGQAVKIGFTQNYDGVYRLLKVITPGVVVIDAEDLGSETSGRIEKHYENYTLVALITAEGATSRTRMDIQANSAGFFVLPAHEVIQRNFHDVFRIAQGGEALEFLSANRYITQRYSVAFSEAYMIPDANGVNVMTELGKDGNTASFREKIAVNSVQPYHHIDEGDGSPDLQWMDDLEEYLVDPDIEEERRFLTYAPRGGVAAYDHRTSMRLGAEDDFFLAILNNRDDIEAHGVRVATYRSDGTLIANNDQSHIVSTADSLLFNIGPAALGAYITGDTHHYFFQFRSGREYSERFYVTIDQSCNTARRFFFLNSFGALDQYTIEGKESRETNVERFIVGKPNMALGLTTDRGDYQRRTYRTEPVRSYSATTRSESRSVARWLMDEFLESPDVRTVIYDHDETIYTRVILETDSAKVGARAARIPFAWSLGVDNVKQRR